jgi:hypothetical protein
VGQAVREGLADEGAGFLDGGDQGGEDSGTHRGQWPPRPPDVQRGDVAVADGFLAGGLGGDGFEGEGDFDEAAVMIVFH